MLQLTSYISKAEQTPEALDPVIVAKLRCAAGLAHLKAKKYKLAARKVCFLSWGLVGVSDLFLALLVYSIPCR